MSYELFVQSPALTPQYSFEAFSALNNSLVIDLGHVNYVNVSSDRSFVTVGAGIRLGALYEALDPSGTTFNGGICPTVGAAGYVAAGGFSLQMRHLGKAVRDTLRLLSLIVSRSCRRLRPFCEGGQR